ncbi:SIFamide-related peptide isoform X2 [Belonocnema kinseyi]|uniref:SIFamide-related peptide isoform X2 n=1 Tax=Belonocnema kinseyi TaxID=2817044 RepID=UPI00143DE03A|nr:SIFamide-related peptide isoform X2 [Belonocnema kinseyi]
MLSCRVILVLLVILSTAVLNAEAVYRKPPFNGSIFGKRSMGITDYDVTNRALATMCEVASETCSIWLNHQDTN